MDGGEYYSLMIWLAYHTDKRRIIYYSFSCSSSILKLSLGSTSFVPTTSAGRRALQGSMHVLLPAGLVLHVLAHFVA
jgi:hypothetical protein